MIDKQTFEENLLKATEYAMSWAKAHVVNPLPEKVRYYIENDVYLDKKLWSFEKEMTYTDFLDAKALTDELWNVGMVPTSINLNVLTVTDEFTIMTILHNEEFTHSHDKLNYQEDGYPPFHPLSPILPPDFDPNAERFDLFWNVKNRKAQVI